MKLAFTGHRPESLPFGENENDPRYIRLREMLLTEITERVKAGYDTFYTGCARGMDIVFGTQVLLVKKTACPQHPPDRRSPSRGTGEPLDRDLAGPLF